MHDLSVTFAQFRLRGISLSAEQGQTLVLLGPSGAGKSVLLETVAGFHAPDAGRIELGGRDVTRLPPEERGLGFMFQDYALFPHLTVEENVAFGLRRRGPGADRRVREVLDLVDARHLMGRRPETLSGGEKQRVALARALAIEPRLFLFDEPLSALDAAMREQLREDLRRLLRSLKASSLYVTHDRLEAQVLADVVAVIRDGVIQQAGDVQEVFDHPANAWVARFLGMQVLRPDRVQPNGAGRARVHVGGGAWDAAVNGAITAGSLEPARLAFRPEDVRLEGPDGRTPPIDGAVPATVEAVVPLGSLFRVDLAGGPTFSAMLSRREYQRLRPAAGDRVLAHIEPADLILVPEGT